MGIDVVAVHGLQSFGGHVGLAGDFLPALGFGVTRGHRRGHAGDLVVGEAGRLAADEPVLGAVGQLGDVGDVIAEPGGGHPVGPDVAGLLDVLVGRDDTVLQLERSHARHLPLAG